MELFKETCPILKKTEWSLKLINKLKEQSIF